METNRKVRWWFVRLEYIFAVGRVNAAAERRKWKRRGNRVPKLYEDEVLHLTLSQVSRHFFQFFTCHACNNYSEAVIGMKNVVLSPPNTIHKIENIIKYNIKHNDVVGWCTVMIKWRKCNVDKCNVQYSLCILSLLYSSTLVFLFWLLQMCILCAQI